MIEIRGLHKSFGDDLILDSVDLTVESGESIVVIGPSGAGKSTLLRCVNGLELFQEGSIQVGDVKLEPGGKNNRGYADAIHRVRLKAGMVFQSFNLFPHLTALENVTLAPIHVLQKDPFEAKKEALELLARVNLRGKEASYPRSLSGGERQRVAIARALAMRPEAILFDEPTSSLDPELVVEVLSVISDLAADGYTLLIVTHQMDFARRSASRVVFLDQGQVVEEGKPDDLFDRPRSPRLQTFLSKCLASGQGLRKSDAGTAS